jgi:hypothetical protein
VRSARPPGQPVCWAADVVGQLLCRTPAADSCKLLGCLTHVWSASLTLVVCLSHTGCVSLQEEIFEDTKHLVRSALDGECVAVHRT